MNRLSKLTRQWLIAFVLVSLTSCGLTLRQSAPPTSLNVQTKPTNEFCALYKPVHWSARDTDQTIIEVKQNNAVWTKFCKTA